MTQLRSYQLSGDEARSVRAALRDRLAHVSALYMKAISESDPFAQLHGEDILTLTRALCIFSDREPAPDAAAIAAVSKPAFSGDLASARLPKALTPIERLRADWYMRHYGKRAQRHHFKTDGTFGDPADEAMYQAFIGCDGRSQ